MWHSAPEALFHPVEWCPIQKRNVYETSMILKPHLGDSKTPDVIGTYGHMMNSNTSSAVLSGFREKSAADLWVRACKCSDVNKTVDRRTAQRLKADKQPIVLRNIKASANSRLTNHRRTRREKAVVSSAVVPPARMISVQKATQLLRIRAYGPSTMHVLSDPILDY
ncbi:hypothetical protein NXC24_PB00001 (plasmid) [Rhizobium sp. NXC24]|nr:hypothetical protein NXC24_PB00001 [Rhizobium sp. NXC24]